MRDEVKLVLERAAEIRVGHGSAVGKYSEHWERVCVVPLFRLLSSLYAASTRLARVMTYVPLSKMLCGAAQMVFPNRGNRIFIFGDSVSL